MIAWSTVAPALKTLFSWLAVSSGTIPVGNPAFQAQWFDGTREFRHPDVQQALMLRVARVAEVQSERRYDYDSDDDSLTEVIFGMREFTLEVRVESHDHRPDLSSWAWSMLERVRTGLLRQRSIDALLAVEVGLVRLSDSRDVSFKFDKRIVHAAMFEATFNAAFYTADDVTTDWFEYAALTSNFTDPAGVTLGSPPNVTDWVIPEE